jgi:spore maturation protein CgeB
MSKCGLNFHLPFQLDSACEVNERTYQLAACGVPQLVDNAKLLTNLYSTDAFFVARNRKEFFSFFQKILANHEIVERKTLAAQKEAFERYTTFHRTATFVEDLLKIYNNPS